MAEETGGGESSTSATNSGTATSSVGSGPSGDSSSTDGNNSTSADSSSAASPDSTNKSSAEATTGTDASRQAPTESTPETPNPTSADSAGADEAKTDEATDETATPPGESGAPARTPGGGDGEFAAEVTSRAQPPNTSPQQLQDMSSRLGETQQSTRATGDRGDEATSGLGQTWTDDGGLALANRATTLGESTRAVGERAGALQRATGNAATQIDNALTQSSSNINNNAGLYDVAKAALPAGESQVATQRMVEQVAAENNNLFQQAANNIAADPAWSDVDPDPPPWTDEGYWDPRRRDPVRDAMINWIDRIGEGVQNAGEWILTTESNGPDADVTANGPDDDGTVASFEAKALGDQGTWGAFGGAATGQYSAGAYASGQINRPGGEDPVIEVDGQLGVTASLDEVPLVEAGPVSLSVEPEVRVGPGAAVTFDPSWENGKFDLNAKVSLSPIIGGGFGVDFSIDTNEIQRSLDSAFSGMFG